MDNHSSYKRWVAFLLLFCLVGLSACAIPFTSQTTGANKPQGGGATPEPGNNSQPAPASNGHTQSMVAANNLVYSASITFASSISYPQALKIITDLGLQSSAFCPSGWKPQMKWRDMFSHGLTIIANVNSAPLWMDRLKATVGVEDVQAVGAHSCPKMGPDTAYFHEHLLQSGTFLRITFSPGMSYDNALDTVSNLWFRIADPCYEQARAQGTKPTWHVQGQADTFAKTHAFVMAATFLNFIHWQQQLHALASVVKVDAPLKTAC